MGSRTFTTAALALALLAGPLAGAAHAGAPRPPSQAAATFTTVSSPRAEIGVTVTTDFTLSPSRYAPGTETTIEVQGSLSTTAQRDTACHSLETRVIAGGVPQGIALDSTDRTIQRAGESHTQDIAIDIDLTAPTRGTLIVEVSLQCAAVKGDSWTVIGSPSKVIWTGRIAPVAGSLTVSPAHVFPDADEFDSRARITASAARGPITVTVSHGGRQVWSVTSRNARVSAMIPAKALKRSGTYTAMVTGDASSRTTFQVSRGWAPLYDAQVAHWPRCSTIGWKYVDAEAPAGGDTGMVDDLRKVFDRYAELTGLRFVEGGADIVIGWADLPRGTNAEAGAGLVSQTLGDGFLRLSRTADRPRVPGFGSAGRGVTLLHEMAHVLGLGHVSDRSLLMYPVHSPGSPLTPQTGDIAGLKDLYAPATCR